MENPLFIESAPEAVLANFKFMLINCTKMLVPFFIFYIRKYTIYILSYHIYTYRPAYIFNDSRPKPGITTKEQNTKIILPPIDQSYKQKNGAITSSIMAPFGVRNIFNYLNYLKSISTSPESASISIFFFPPFEEYDEPCFLPSITFEPKSTFDLIV